MASESSEEASRIFTVFSDSMPGRIERFESPVSAMASLSNYLLIILYIGPCGDSWDSTARRIVERLFRFPIVAVADMKTLSHLGALLENHVEDIISLPATPEELKQRLSSILSQRMLSNADLLKDEAFARRELEMLKGKSENFVSAVRQIRTAGASDASVLICGETGTGKELFARAIHYLGHRSAAPFVPVNCGAIPESLFENELFGHSRGAYTGASETKEGLIHEAEGGTLFLDEINALSPFTQVKLLRFLEDKKYKALGSSKHFQANVRVISATNSDLVTADGSCDFRQDLLYRINALTFHLPPLRERHGDIPILAEHYLDKFARVKQRGKMCFSGDALRKLASYSWPGNIRELEHTIEKVVLVTTSNLIRANDIQLDQSVPSEFKPFREARQSALSIFEKEYLLKLLTDNNWNISKSAQYAKKDRRWLQRLLRKHGLTGAVNS